MRATVTLDSDTEQIVRQRMIERQVSFRQALNDLIREGGALAEGPRQFRTQTRPMGHARVDVGKALRVAAEFEDADLTWRPETES